MITPINTTDRIRSRITIEKFSGATYNSENRLDNIGTSLWKFFLGPYPNTSGNVNNQITAIPNLGTDTAETILVKTTGNMLDFTINGLILQELEYQTRSTIGRITNQEGYTDIRNINQITYVTGGTAFRNAFPNGVRSIGELFRFVNIEMPSNDLISRYQISFHFPQWGKNDLKLPYSTQRSNFLSPLVFGGYLKSANPHIGPGPNMKLDLAFQVGNAALNFGSYIGGLGGANQEDSTGVTPTT